MTEEILDYYRKQTHLLATMNIDALCKLQDATQAFARAIANEFVIRSGREVHRPDWDEIHHTLGYTRPDPNNLTAWPER